jgi:heme/copper-type cytochrome/quinol oxidase subunit 2
MTSKTHRYALAAAMVLVAVLLVLDLAYLVQGSQEPFPTAEQEDKVRTVTAGIAVVLLGIELMLASLLWRLRPRGGAAPAGASAR